MKSFLYRFSFVHHWLDEYYNAGFKAGGVSSFPAAQRDVLETMRDDLDAKAEELAQEKLSKLLSIVDERMIVSFNIREKAVYIGGVRITDPGQLQNLKAEAELYLASDLWKLLVETPKRLAEKAMFEDDGKLENQLLKGRAILYTLDTQRRVLETLKGYSPK